MALTIPPGVDAQGSVLVKFVPELTAPADPTVAEVTAATAIDLSCYLTKEGFKPGAETDKWKDERLCTKNVFEQDGATTYKIEALEYIYDPQEPESLSNKAYAALPRGTSGYLVVRWGKDIENNPELAVGDIVDVWPVTVGNRVKQPPEENSKLKVQQEVSVTGAPHEDRPLAA